MRPNEEKEKVSTSTEEKKELVEKRNVQTHHALGAGTIFFFSID